MSEICNCCKGTEKLTPKARLNPPDLSALSYRAGTHASFLTTMKARLSNLVLTNEDFGYGAPTDEPPSALQALTMRASSDPAIALLDAWALVGDVLTFYQERIANEGFLRTAVERLSVLELARLVGYRVRPGIAASVFLAYTLEKNTSVEIPLGAHVQSVPGPGELPQTFETSDKLEARAEWNTLQLRLTRPQNPRQVLQEKRALYFKGTETKLKPNDPLLLDPESGTATLLRVMSVTPNPAAGNTKVTVQLWTGEPLLTRSVAASKSSSSQPASAEVIERLRILVDRQRGAEGFDVNTDTQTAKRVIEQLGKLDNELAASRSYAEIKQAVDASLLTLREDHRLATEGNFTKLLPWIDDIVSNLDRVSQRFTETEATVSGTAFESASTIGTSPGLNRDRPSIQAVSPIASSLGPLTEILDAFEKPVSRQPATSRRLGRNTAASFSIASDAWPKLLMTMRPALRNVLYRAWENLPVTVPTAARVYALRTRASVFGHNAPLKPVTDARTGRVTGTEEWTLSTTSSPGAIRERCTVLLSVALNDTIDVGVAIVTIDSQDSPVSPLVDAEARGNRPNAPAFNLTLNTPDHEVVVVTILQVTDSLKPESESSLSVDLQFTKRKISVNATRPGTTDRNWVTTTNGFDPTSVFDRATESLLQLIITGVSQSSVASTPTEEPRKVSLDVSRKEILPGTWAALEIPGQAQPLITKIRRVREASRADYGIAGAGTQLELQDNWIAPETAPFELIRNTTVLAQSELLELAEEPIDPLNEPLCGDRIELANLVSGLEAGRWLIVTGERADIKHITRSEVNTGSLVGTGPTIELSDEVGALSNVAGNSNTDIRIRSQSEQVLPGVVDTELVMLGGVEQGYDTRFPGDQTHTTLLLATGLANCYKRDTVTIYGNVVKATHGETKHEVLGSGDGSQAMQRFALRQSPLTYLSAPTPAGADSTLQVRVNDVLWHETDGLVGLGPKDRRFVTRTDDKDETTVVFGNGHNGARLPTGVENVKAVYRTGIGKPGNVKAQQISSVVTKPLGVKSVINPLPATGGADREDRDQARRNAPLAVMALDRLISVQDYEDLARTYAGIAKASSAPLSDGRRQLVHVTIAGSDDIPIATTSDLFLNLRLALHQFGDPSQPLQLAVRSLKLLIVSARVRLHPDYQWETVEPKIRVALLDKFSFARRELGQDALPSEALSVIQAQAGVTYVDLDVFDAVDETASAATLVTRGSALQLKERVRVFKARIDKQRTDPAKRLLPAQIAYLTPAIPETLILSEVVA